MIVSVLALCWVQVVGGIVTISSYQPNNGPLSGGTVIAISGEGFITTGNERSKCNFQREDSRSNAFSLINQIHNSTHISCVLPEFNEVFFSQPLPLEGTTVRLVVTAGEELSPGMDFLVYDISSIIVTSISPAQALANSSNGTSIAVAGQGFIDTGTIACTVMVDDDITASSPAIFIDSSSLGCVLPPVRVVIRTGVGVSLNGQTVSVVHSVADLFTFYSPPPLVISSHFSSSHIQVLVQFDREIEIGLEEASTIVPTTSESDDSIADLGLNCSQVLDASSVSLVGARATCLWQNSQQRAILIHLSSDTSVTENTTLELNGNSLRTRNVHYSRLASGDVVVTSLPGGNLVPVAVLELPTMIPRCGGLVVSGEKSLYGGAKKLLYEWRLGEEMDESGSVIPDPLLATYIPTGFSTQSTLNIPSSVFYSEIMSGSGSGMDLFLPTDYIVQLVVRNYFGYDSSPVLQNVTTARDPAPPVVILGGVVQTVRAWNEVMLEGRVSSQVDDDDGCTIQDTRVSSYAWSLVEDNLREGLDILWEGLQTNSSVLILAPDTLQPGAVYVISLTVAFHTGNSSTVQVTLLSEEGLESRIEGGVRRAVGTDDPIDLDGTPSSIHHDPGASSLNIVWGCLAVGVPELEGAISSCENFTDSDSIAISLPMDTLPAGGYVFTLTLSLIRDRDNITTLQSSATQLVVIFPNPVPRIRITSVRSERLDSILVHRSFFLQAEISTVNEGLVQWRAEYVDGELLVYKWWDSRGIPIH